MTALTWTNERRRLRDLVPWEHNPKRMNKKQADGLRASDLGDSWGLTLFCTMAETHT